MESELFSWLGAAARLFRENLLWMGWNLFLAWVPLGLAIALFHFSPGWNQQNLFQKGLWVLGAIVFVVFLPNAPYVLTDLIHLFETAHRVRSPSLFSLILVPQYALFLLLGFAGYAVSLYLLGRFLERQTLKHWIFPVELALHGLSAVGVYLGRFDRFNSWDLATRPSEVIMRVLADLLMLRSLLIMAVSFALLTVLFESTKPLITSFLKRFATVTEVSSTSGPQLDLEV